jgi:hypothetical protein
MGDKRIPPHPDPLPQGGEERRREGFFEVYL